MKRKVFIATDYLTDYFNATSSGGNAIINSLKIALLLYDNIDLDVDEERYQEIVNWVASQLSNIDAKEDFINSLSSYKYADTNLKFESNFNTSLFVAAAYEAICEKESTWYQHWPVGILRAQELAILAVSYELYCNKFSCEFYTSFEHRILVDKLISKVKNGFSKDGPAQHLLESIRSFKFPSQPQDMEIELALNSVGDTFEKFADTLEKRPIKSQEIDIEPQNIYTSDRQLLFLPNPSELSWSDIFKLRRSPYRESFLDKTFADFNSTSKTDVDNYLLNHIYDLLDKKKPKIVRNIATRTVSNIPVPIIGINPFSIFSSVTDTVNDIKELKSFGWAYFIAEANLLKNKKTKNH